MESFNSYYTSHLNEDLPVASRDLLQPSHPIEDVHETSMDGRGEATVSATEYTNTEILRISPSMLNEKEEQLEVVKDCDNTGVMEQADRINQMTLESKDPTLGKSIRSYLDESLPDLLRSGSPLRRRVSSPVSDTVRYYVYNTIALYHMLYNSWHNIMPYHTGSFLRVELSTVPFINANRI